MIHAVGQAAGSHTLDTEAVGGGITGNVGIHAGADIHAAVFVVVTNHKKPPKTCVIARTLGEAGGDVAIPKGF